MSVASRGRRRRRSPGRRTAAGRAHEPRALELAVRASVRHRDTRYDSC
ncbi:MAG: DUF2293 domain-containing protein [Solirubrobacteraceae bacterium]